MAMAAMSAMPASSSRCRSLNWRGGRLRLAAPHPPRLIHDEAQDLLDVLQGRDLQPDLVESLGLLVLFYDLPLHRVQDSEHERREGDHADGDNPERDPVPERAPQLGLKQQHQAGLKGRHEQYRKDDRRPLQTVKAHLSIISRSKA